MKGSARVRVSNNNKRVRYGRDVKGRGNEKEEEEDDPLRSGECEKCECVRRGRVEENEKEAKAPANEDGERVEGKER